MPLQLQTIPDQRWPEAPEVKSFCIYEEGAMGLTEVTQPKMSYANKALRSCPLAQYAVRLLYNIDDCR